MTRLRVLHVIGGGDTGGAMAYVLPLLTALRTEGCDANLLCLGSGGLAVEASRRDLPCEIISMDGPWDVRIVPGLRRYLAGGGWEVVHTHGMRANLPVRMLVRTMFSESRPRPALFTTVHSDLALDYTHPLKSWAYLALERFSAGSVDGFFCVSAALAARLAERGISRSRIRVVYPGIESVDFGDRTTAPSNGPEIVGTVARLVDVKDLGLLLEAAGLLRKRRPNLRVVVVGDGPERPALERQAAETGLRGVVEFRGEVRPVWSALREFQVYALTSISEGVPLSVLEAMTMGLPVVATAVGGLPEILDDGVNGYLVARLEDRAATAASLAARLETLLADPDLRQRMGAASRRRVIERFSTITAARETLRFYERVLAGRSGNGGW